MAALSRSLSAELQTRDDSNESQKIESKRQKPPEKESLKDRDDSKKIPGPQSFPIFGASWLYSWFGPYSHEQYHLSNFDKFANYGPVVREEVLWNYPLFHLFDSTDIDKVLR